MGSLQTFYLAGRMNVENLPANFRQVSDGFQYTVLNIRLPWESTVSKSRVSPLSAATGNPQTRGLSHTTRARECIESLRLLPSNFHAAQWLACSGIFEELQSWQPHLGLLQHACRRSHSGRGADKASALCLQGAV